MGIAESFCRLGQIVVSGYGFAGVELWGVPLPRLQNMRIRAIHAAMKKGQYQSAASMMDSLGKFLGEGEAEVSISAPNLVIKVEKPAD